MSFFFLSYITLHQPRRVIGRCSLCLSWRLINVLWFSVTRSRENRNRPTAASVVRKKTYALVCVWFVANKSVLQKSERYAWRREIIIINNYLYYALTPIWVLVLSENDSHKTFLCVVAGIIKYYKYFMWEINRAYGMVSYGHHSRSFFFRNKVPNPF